ncbi:MAG: hypothetical protein NVSMB12_12270 [Acidimicrobiales bacterium]
MVTAHEREHPGPTGRLARDFERSLDRVRTGRAGELHLVIEASRLQDALLECLEESGLGAGVEIQPLDQTVFGEVLQEGSLDAVVVVSVVESACPGQEVQVRTPVCVVDNRPLGASERRRERTAVRADVRLPPLEDRGRRRPDGVEQIEQSDR